MRLRGGKDKEAMDMQRDLALSEASRPQSQYMEEYVNSLGRSVYSIIDPDVAKLLKKHKLESLIPALSHLNRMTQIHKDDVEIDRLDLEYIFLRLKCTMKEHEYSTEQAQVIETLKFFAMHIPTDSFEGFKAKLLAYTMKIIKTELEEKKTKGILG